MSRVDPFSRVVCELRACGKTVKRREAAPVSIVFDGTRIRGLACSPAHAEELRRGWTTRDAYGADLIGVTKQAHPTPVKAG